jgi:hypothetical protein
MWEPKHFKELPYSLIFQQAELRCARALSTSPRWIPVPKLLKGPEQFQYAIVLRTKLLLVNPAWYLVFSPFSRYQHWNSFCQWRKEELILFVEWRSKYSYGISSDREKWDATKRGKNPLPDRSPIPIANAQVFSRFLENSVENSKATTAV